MYLFSPTLSQISLKNSFGKVVFQILVKIEMMQNKNRLFGGYFETVQHFQNFFCRIVTFFIDHTCIVQFHCKIPVGKWFS